MLVMPQRIVMRERPARADPFEQEVARNFKQHVAEIDDARPESVHGFGEAQVLHHLQLGEPEIVSVQPRHQEQQHEEGNEASRDLGVDGVELGRMWIGWISGSARDWWMHWVHSGGDVLPSIAERSDGWSHAKSLVAKNNGADYRHEQQDQILRPTMRALSDDVIRLYDAPRRELNLPSPSDLGPSATAGSDDVLAPVGGTPLPNVVAEATEKNCAPASPRLSP
jgi:hypothetical protein